MTIQPALYSSEKMDWETPPALFKALDDEFHFTLDVCANERNHKCARYLRRNNMATIYQYRGTEHDHTRNTERVDALFSLQRNGISHV